MEYRSKLAGLRHALGSSYAKAAAGVVATGAAAIFLDSYASQILPGASYFFSGIRDEALMEINFVLGLVSDSTFSADGSGFISDHRPSSYWAGMVAAETSEYTIVAAIAINKLKKSK